MVEAWLRTAQSLIESEDIDPADLLPVRASWLLQEALAQYHFCFKHPAFSEEREWRLVKLVNVREELRLLDDQRRDAMLAATRDRMAALGMDMPRLPHRSLPRDAEGVEIYFRHSNVGLVPYVELPLIERAGVFSGRLPLSEVAQGRTRHPELSMDSLKLFLEAHGYGMHTDVQVSGIPLRP